MSWGECCWSLCLMVWAVDAGQKTESLVVYIRTRSSSGHLSYCFKNDNSFCFLICRYRNQSGLLIQLKQLYRNTASHSYVWFHLCQRYVIPLNVLLHKLVATFMPYYVVSSNNQEGWLAKAIFLSVCCCWPLPLADSLLFFSGDLHWTLHCSFAQPLLLLPGCE